MTEKDWLDEEAMIANKKVGTHWAKHERKS